MKKLDTNQGEMLQRKFYLFYLIELFHKCWFMQLLMVDCKAHREKVATGIAKKHASGFLGSGYKFDEAEEAKKKKRQKLAKDCMGV